MSARLGFLRAAPAMSVRPGRSGSRARPGRCSSDEPGDNRLVSRAQHDVDVATRERRMDRGLEQAARIVRETAQEIRQARRGSGLSIRSVARSVGMSESTFGRIERSELAGVTVAQLATACAAVGLRFTVRAYPDGDPIRDAGQARLLERFRAHVPDVVGWRTEVPLPIAGDLRAWDGQCRFGPVVVGVEAETRLDDLQALDRRIGLKGRDSGVALVILVVADTARNRRRLGDYREALRASFPLDTRAVLAAMRAGRPPAASGIAVL
jgi:transcriptional regulator with XRE-family HTH domain